MHMHPLSSSHVSTHPTPCTPCISHIITPSCALCMPPSPHPPLPSNPLSPPHTGLLPTRTDSHASAQQQLLSTSAPSTSFTQLPVGAGDTHTVNALPGDTHTDSSICQQSTCSQTSPAAPHTAAAAAGGHGGHGGGGNNDIEQQSSCGALGRFGPRVHSMHSMRSMDSLTQATVSTVCCGVVLEVGVRMVNSVL